MIIQCSDCESRFNIDPALLGEKGRKLRCSSCKTVFFQPPVAEGTTEVRAGQTNMDDLGEEKKAPAPEKPAEAPKEEEKKEEIVIPEIPGDDDEEEAPAEDKEEESSPEEDQEEEITIPDIPDEDGDEEEEAPEEEPEEDIEEEITIPDIPDEDGDEEEEVPEEEPEADEPEEEIDIPDIPDEDDGEAPAEEEPTAEEEKEDDDGLGDLDLADILPDLASDDEEEIQEVLLDEETLRAAAEAEDDDVDLDIEEIDLDGDSMPIDEMDMEEMEEDFSAMAKEAGADDVEIDEEDEEADLTPEEEEALADLAAGDGMLPDDLLKEIAEEHPEEDFEEEEEDEEEAGPSWKDKIKIPSFSIPSFSLEALTGRTGWIIVGLLGVLWMVGLLMKTPLGGWFEAKTNEATIPFRLSEIRGEYREYDFGPVLIVRGSMMNTKSMPRTAPVVRVSLLNKQNKTLRYTRVVPGLILGEQELGSATEKALRTAIKHQADDKRYPPPQVPWNKDVDFQAMFLNPPLESMRFKVDLELSAAERRKKERTGTKSFSF